MASLDIESQLNELRKKYGELSTSKRMQNESIINEFILLMLDYEDYDMIDHPLDIDAFNFIQKANVKMTDYLTHPDTPHTFIDDAELAKILPSGEKISDIEVRVGDFIDDIKSFIAVSPICWVVGGVVNNEDAGSKNDVDILITVPERSELEKIIMFRIARMVTPEIRKRISFLPEPGRSYVGPFTCNLPLFRLVVERIPDAEIIKMAEDAIKLRIKSDETEKREDEANKAINNDKLTPGEFYKPSKPVRGYIDDDPQTLTAFLDIYDKYYSYPSLSSKKYDGERCLVAKINDKITIFSEDGTKLDKLKNLRSTISELEPVKLIIEGELENWNYENKQHLPRETVNTNIEDDNFVLNVFDCLYYSGKISEELYNEIDFFDKEGIDSWKVKYKPKD